MKSGDPERLYWALSGQGGGGKKLKPEIIAFITHDFGHVYPRNRYSYSKEIREDVKDVYEVELSTECIRPLLGKLKKTYQEKESLSEEEKKHLSEFSELNTPSEVSQIIPDNQPVCECRESTIHTNLDALCSNNEVYKPNNSKVSFNSKGQVIFCFHLGVLIFAPFFNKLQEKGLNFIYKWLVAVLLGYQNIEQSK